MIYIKLDLVYRYCQGHFTDKSRSFVGVAKSKKGELAFRSNL